MVHVVVIIGFRSLIIKKTFDKGSHITHSKRRKSWWKITKTMLLTKHVLGFINPHVPSGGINNNLTIRNSSKQYVIRCRMVDIHLLQEINPRMKDDVNAIAVRSVPAIIERNVWMPLNADWFWANITAFPQIKARRTNYRWRIMLSFAGNLLNLVENQSVTFKLLIFITAEGSLGILVTVSCV